MEQNYRYNSGSKYFNQTNQTIKTNIKGVKNVERKIILIITHQTERTKADHPHTRFE